jgi:crossover junction endodeoxyribonuclease RuvC
MRVLGLDPGLQRTGWGIVACGGGRLVGLASGVLRSSADRPLADRLAELYRGLAEVITLWSPVAAAVEETFVNKNPASTLKLGQARAVSLLAPALAGLEVHEYATQVVKKAVVGTGRADKAQVQMMIARLLPTIAAGGADAADALAVAICHAHHLETGRAWRRRAA